VYYLFEVPAVECWEIPYFPIWYLHSSNDIVADLVAYTGPENEAMDYERAYMAIGCQRQERIEICKRNCNTRMYNKQR